MQCISALEYRISKVEDWSIRHSVCKDERRSQQDAIYAMIYVLELSEQLQQIPPCFRNIRVKTC